MVASKPNIMVIGDVHCKKGIPNDRLRWAGELAAERKPDYIVQIGDWFDFTSLCMQIKGKTSYEGQRYSEDLEAGIDGLRVFNKALSSRDTKSYKYKPKKFITIGNHDNRADREAELDSKLEGHIGLKDCQFEEFGWEVIPFLEPLYLEGIILQHFFTKGLQDRPLSSVTMAKAMLKENKASCIQGHQHLLDVATEINGKFERSWAIVCGCYFEHPEDYVSQRAQAAWWRGILYLHNVQNGDFDLETISLASLKEKYGKK